MNAQDHIRKECPYCHEPVKARGLHTHVMNTDDDAHGAYREVPDGFDAKSVPVMGQSRQTFAVQSNNDTNSRYKYLCHYCGDLTKNERGLKIHLGKNAGNIQHPEDASFEDHQWTRVPVDEDGEPYMDVDEIRERRFQFIDDSLTIGLPEVEAEDAPDPCEDPDFPENASKPEKVAIYLDKCDQHYYNPSKVCAALDVSRSTFYEGRALYDSVQSAKTGEALF